MSFLYDVVSTSGNTGRGRIVVQVVRESVPDYPVIADTVLTVENRDDFEDGVDVIAGKATWSAGEVDDLAVTLWGDPDGVSVSGTELRGDLPAKTRLIPFAVTGRGASGTVTSYAFLRVPGDDDVSLALRSGAQTPEATELASVSFDMATLVARPPATRLEWATSCASPARGPRHPASSKTARPCATTRAPARRGSTRARCRFASTARTTGPTSRCPITVIPLDPQPELHPASLTVGPGETATFDLTQMTTWQLREDWDGIQYALEHAARPSPSRRRAPPSPSPARTPRSRAPRRSRSCR